MSSIPLYKRFFQGIGIVPKLTTTSANTVLGDLDVTSDNRLNFFGASNDKVTTDAVTTTLTNKSISGSANTITNIPDSALSSDVVITTAVQTLTNKTIDAGSNTITGLTNSNLSGSAGITGANIANTTIAGSNLILNTVDNAELAQMPTNTIKGNNTGGTANATDLTVSQVNTMLGTLSNPMTTLGDIIYEDATPAPTRLPGNTTSTINFLSQTGTGSISAVPAWAAFIPPTIQTFTTVGTFTYTLPTSPRPPNYIKIKMVGSGGGGAGSGGAGTAGAGGVGAAVSFGGTLLIAGGGGPGATTGGSGGASGTNTTSSGPIIIVNTAGGSGGSGSDGGTNIPGGNGGNSYFGGGGGGSYGGAAGTAASTNTGSGGGGAGTASAFRGGAGGGAGGYIEAIISNPSSTYSIVIGANGGGGSAGTGSGAAMGGNGATGQIIIEEYYQ